ncbi:chorismate synthase [Christensenellaceae bacterium OttesenSCG-928-K19]|nr:chorismate synthase [Christensenellaceae bacterium OttesenSCG-928-K19]
MSYAFGNAFKVTIFGESHASAIGITIDGIPAGTKIDMDEIQQSMKRRAPGAKAGSTSRKEPDKPQVMCGILDGKTTGAPLTAIIKNKDTRSQDYEKTATLLRPGHADYTGYVKYNGANDFRGGGHFSGRLTAPLVFAGALARQWLAQKGITIGAHIKTIAGVVDDDFPVISQDALLQMEQKKFPVVNDASGKEMIRRIAKASEEKDSVGGIIACAAIGLPAGLGEPFFDSVESLLAHMLFSIPAVKGLEFGSGFAVAGMAGSYANDCPVIENGQIRFATNNNGGINGGITNGMPLLFRVAVKPTPSIGKTQKTVDIEKRRETEITIEGRHDACIVPRAVEVVKCAAAIVLMDLYLQNGRNL